MSKRTEVQEHYSDVKTLHEMGVNLTPEKLAHLTGGKKEDLTGIVRAHVSPEAKERDKKRQTELVEMAGMSNSDGLIGFALIAQDVQHAVEKIKARFSKSDTHEG